MLPLWRKELRIVLCPSEVIVVALTNGLRRKVISQSILPVGPDNPADWRPAITALEHWLAENGPGKADVKIQLSNCFVRFAMMPFSEEVIDYAERVTVAGLLFESIYGEAAKQWELTLDKAHFEVPCVVAAIDSGLSEAMNYMSLASGLRITAVQPYAASVLNAFSNEIQSEQGMLVVVDHGQGILFDIKDKKIAGVRKIMLGNDQKGSEIPDALRREILISGLDTETATVYLHIAGVSKANLPEIAGINMVALLSEQESDYLGTGYEMVCLAGVR